MELKTARLTILIDPEKKLAFEALCRTQEWLSVSPGLQKEEPAADLFLGDSYRSCCAEVLP